MLELNMLKHHKLIHYGTFFFGLCMFLYAIISAIIFNNSRFYTIFALGAYFVLDFIDYKINKSSVMAFFLGRRHWYAFLIFLAISTIACFLVDFVLGVSITKMWRWRNYNAFDFAMMFLFMNASYVLGMYEIFRIIRNFFKGEITEEHLLKFRLHRYVEKVIGIIAILLGIGGFLIPFFVVIYKIDFPLEFAMLLTFIGLMLIPDAMTFFLRGRPIIPQILRVNLLMVFSVFFTIVIASLGTEILNLFGKEWEYLRMPFEKLTVLNIPLAVFVGWVPLVISTLCIVNLVKHLTYLYDSKKSKAKK